MYSIDSDGAYKHTMITKDGEPIKFEICFIHVSEEGSYAKVDGVIGELDHLIISGVYTVISKGSFVNTKVFHSKHFLLFCKFLPLLRI